MTTHTCTTCRRDLHWQSMKLGLDKCSVCRKRAKYFAYTEPQRQTGRIVGEHLARFYA